MTQTLTTLPIPVLIRQIAVPASVGFFFNTMFNAVDSWYGGRISTQALAALSLSLPVFFLIIAVGSGLYALQGIRKPMFALWIGLWRQIVAPAAVFWLLTRLLGVGLTGIWWGIFGFNWSAAAVAWLYARRQLKKQAQRFK